VHHATLLKLNSYYAYPALSNGEPVEPFTSTCLASASAMTTISQTARNHGLAELTTPLLIWAEWVAARVLFGEFHMWILSRS
jgi:hypothetical protein